MMTKNTMMTVQELMQKKTENTKYISTIQIIHNMADNMNFPYTDTLEMNIDKEIMDNFSHIFANDISRLGLSYKAVQASDDEYRCVFYFKDEEIESRRKQAYLKVDELIHEIEKGQQKWVKDSEDKPFEVDLEASHTLIPLLNSIVKTYGFVAIPNIERGITVLIPKRLGDL